MKSSSLPKMEKRRTNKAEVAQALIPNVRLNSIDHEFLITNEQQDQ
jgi:hypothetical protein